MSLQSAIDEFLYGQPHAVVGASRDRAKYGNKVLRAFIQSQRPVYPINPFAEEVEGLKAYPDLAALPESVYGVSVITPPEQTEAVVALAVQLGVRHLWLQPGSESQAAVDLAQSAGVDLIAGGPCILVALGYRESGS